MNEKQARKFGRALDELRRVANKQGWAMLPLTDSEGAPLRIYAIGHLADVAVLQDILKEVKDDTQSGE
jgi:hypothetical protein